MTKSFGEFGENPLLCKPAVEFAIRKSDRANSARSTFHRVLALRKQFRIEPLIKGTRINFAVGSAYAELIMLLV